ncbi:MAG TPA: MerR family transcriptional regulator [Acidimicrobiales bacterium]
MADQDPGIYSIGAVGRMLGVPPGRLRTWEERYGIVTAERSDGGHRLYSRDQVERLQFVARQVEQGTSPGDAFRLLAERLGQQRSLAAPHGEEGGGLLIMLAERDPFSAEFAEYFLRTEGYATVLAFDVEKAELEADERSPQLAVVDLLISGGSGAKLCEALRRRGIGRILAVSTLQSRDEALAAGADAFLQKPLEPLQLVSTVKDLLGASAYLR